MLNKKIPEINKKNFPYDLVVAYWEDIVGSCEWSDIPDIKIADSFGVKICAMPDVDQKYLEHAKKVMDGLIDYNDDGIVDNQPAIDRVISTGSVYAILLLYLWPCPLVDHAEM